MGGASPCEPGRCDPGRGRHANSECRRFEEEDERSGAGKARARRLLRQTRSAHVISGTRTGLAKEAITVEFPPTGVFKPPAVGTPRKLRELMQIAARVTCLMVCWFFAATTAAGEENNTRKA